MKEKIISLLKNQGLLRYSKNTSWLFIEKFIRMTVGVFLGVWVARYLGPNQFGLFSYAQSFVALFLGITTLGLDEIIIRELVKNNYKESILGTSFFLRLFGALILLILLWVSLYFSSEDNYTITLIFIIASSSIFQAFNVIDLYFQSEVKSKFVVIANMFSFSISSLFKISFIVLELPLITFAWLILIDNILLTFGYIYFLTKKSNIRFNKLKFKLKLGITLLKDSWPLIFNSIFIAIYMKIDQVMIKQILSETEVGHYAAAVKISEIWYFIPVVVSASFFPSILNSKKENHLLYESRIKALYFIMLWLSIFIGIVTFFLGEYLINILYGEQYKIASNILKVHIWSGIFVFIGVVSGKWLLAENLQKISMFNTAIGAILNILLNYYLLKKIGVLGAAWGTLISYFIAAYFALLFWKKSRPNFVLINKSIFNVIDIKKVS